MVKSENPFEGPIFPQPFPNDFSFLVSKTASPIRLEFLIELAIVFCPICIVKCTLADSFTVFEFAVIFFHFFVISPPHHLSLPVRLSILPLPNIFLVLPENHHSPATTLPFLVTSPVFLKSASYRPLAYSLPLRQVILEHAHIHGATCIEKCSFLLSLAPYNLPFVS